MNTGELALLLGGIALVAVVVVGLLQGWATGIVNNLPSPVVQAGLPL